MSNVKQIFNYIAGMNPTASTVSSIGSFVSSFNQQVADGIVNEVVSALPQGTLAHKIATTARNFSAKQLWVIAFELEKNSEFASMVAKFYADLDREANMKAAASKSKLAANKEASADVLASVKAAGKKLGDYYAFIKSNKQFAREFYSKKYSQQSVTAFLSL